LNKGIPKPELIKALQTASRTGEIAYGSREVVKLVLHGKAKLVVLSANAPPEVKRDIMYYSKLSRIPVVVFDGTNIELGGVIGRPHSVSALAIIDPGQSKILDLIQVSSE
jgi:large subunit ribosomal protein L30e